VLRNLSGVTCRVADLDAAKKWYRGILGRSPVLDSPFAVIFVIGEDALSLIRADDAPAPNEGSPVVYWQVDDLDAAYSGLLEAGATAQTEPYLSGLGSRVARVIDPFGNVLGITCRGSVQPPKSVEDQPSDSAAGVALWRAIAAGDPRDEIRGPDTLAHLFLTEDFRKLANDRASCEWMMKKVPGSYEYFIARTAWLDSVVRENLDRNVPQMVFLGAGYDTRAIRFRERIRDTRIFEVDSAPTQGRKLRLLEQGNIASPPQVIYVSLNLLRDSLAAVLTRAGYDPRALTLFIWEGVIYYLPPAAVDQTLDFVRKNSAAGSTLCFDYLIHAPDMQSRHGVKESQEAMKKSYRAEPIEFRIDEGNIQSFLSERGFTMIDHLLPADMERRILTLRDGTLAGHVLACFGFVEASVLS